MKKIVIPNVKLKYEYFINEQGEVYSKATNSFLRPSKIAKGYLRYGLKTEAGENTLWLIDWCYLLIIQLKIWKNLR